MIFWSSRSESNNILLVDIESNSVGVALVAHGSNSLPNILAHVRTSYHVADEAPVETFEKAMLMCLREALHTIHDELPLLKADGLGTSASRAYIYFTSPWVISRLKEIAIREKEITTLDGSAIQAIVESEEIEFKEDLEDIFDGQGLVFPSQITGLYVNGYKASFTMAKKAVSADLHFTLTGAKLDLIRKVEAEILKVFELGDHFVYQNFMTAFNKVLFSAFSNIHSALLINMTDELSDILFIHQDNPAGTATLPLGIAALARELAASLGLPLEIACSYISLYEDGVLDESFVGSIENILQNTETKWKDMWSKVGADVFKGKDFPYTVFLAGPLHFEQRAKRLLEKVFEGHEIVVVGMDNEFAKHLTSSKKDSLTDPKLSMLASLSYKQ
jgi:hypothetical protein